MAGRQNQTAPQCTATLQASDRSRSRSSPACQVTVIRERPNRGYSEYGDRLLFHILVIQCTIFCRYVPRHRSRRWFRSSRAVGAVARYAARGDAPKAARIRAACWTSFAVDHLAGASCCALPSAFALGGVSGGSLGLTASTPTHGCRGFLAELLLSECDDRARRRAERRTEVVGFPREKSIRQFGFDANPAID